MAWLCSLFQVGSGMSERVMAQMNACGRVVICGTMAGYNDKNGPNADNQGTDLICFSFAISQVQYGITILSQTLQHHSFID